MLPALRWEALLVESPLVMTVTVMLRSKFLILGVAWRMNGREQEDDRVELPDRALDRVQDRETDQDHDRNRESMVSTLGRSSPQW